MWPGSQGKTEPVAQQARPWVISAPAWTVPAPERVDGLSQLLGNENYTPGTIICT